MVINKTVHRSTTTLSGANHLASSNFGYGRTFSKEALDPPFILLPPIDSCLGYTITKTNQTIHIEGVNQQSVDLGVTAQRKHFSKFVNGVNYLFNWKHQLLWTSTITNFKGLLCLESKYDLAAYQTTDTWEDFLVKVATYIQESSQKTEWAQRVFFLIGGDQLYWATDTLVDALIKEVIRGEHYYVTGHEEPFIWYLVLSHHPAVFQALEGCALPVYTVASIVKATSEKSI